MHFPRTLVNNETGANANMEGQPILGNDWPKHECRIFISQWTP